MQRQGVRLNLDMGPTIDGVRAGGMKCWKRPSERSTAGAILRRTEKVRSYSPAGELTDGRISSVEAPHFLFGRLPILSTSVPPSMISSWLIQHFV